MITKLLIIAALLAAPPTITGRTEATPGELVVLKATTPTDVYTWVFDRSQLPDTLECSHSLAFATPRPGVYRFWLVVHEDGQLSTVSHTVTITGSQPSHPQPEQGASPEAPISVIDDLAARIAKQAVDMNDPETLALLVSAWRSSASAIRAGPDLQAAAATLDKAQQAAFAARPLQRRRYGPDWLEGWRKPVDVWIAKAVESGTIKTAADYAALWAAVADQFKTQGQ